MVVVVFFLVLFGAGSGGGGPVVDVARRRFCALAHIPLAFEPISGRHLTLVQPWRGEFCTIRKNNVVGLLPFS